MNNFFADVRYALRNLAKSPGFLIAAVLTLTLGIAANTTIFSLVYSVLLRPLRLENPGELVSVGEAEPSRMTEEYGVSFPNFLDWKKDNRAFRQMAAYRNEEFVLYGHGEPVRLLGTQVTSEFFATLGAHAARGRTFLAEEDRPGAEPVVVLSDAAWRERFQSDPEILGKAITLDDARFTVVGVLPAEFQFPLAAQLWTSLGRMGGEKWMQHRAVHIHTVVARLSPGVSVPQAQKLMSGLFLRIQELNPGADPGHLVRVVPLKESQTSDVRTTLFIFSGAVGFVLLITCANVAGLLLVRAAARQREWAIRAALGASQSRMFGQLLTEGLLLALTGGILGVLLSLWAVDFLPRILEDPRIQTLSLDAPVLAFALVVTLASGVLFSLAPALHAARTNLNAALKQAGERVGGFGVLRLRSALVVGEIALSLILLAGSGLLLKSFWQLVQVNPGFRTDHLLTVRISLPESKYTTKEQAVNYYRDLPERLEQIPGVQSVSAVSRLPISGGDGQGMVTVEGQPMSPQEAPPASFRRILPNYFRTMGIPLRAGREFDLHDGAGEPAVVIINESFAKRFWPAGDAVGHRIKVGPPENEPWITIVGVVADVRNVGLDTDPTLATYEPHRQRPWTAMNLAIRTGGDPASVFASLSRMLRESEKDLLISEPATMAGRISNSLSSRRLILGLLASFAGAALLLAAIGIAGVMS
ncbi:MAG: ABC transporter permease, partial [Acidobacteria bacterium]|nr:ABC transporter permease [Acidobacteriota bacterium]